jgi:hypothetical protein
MSPMILRTALVLLVAGCSSLAWPQGDFDLEAQAVPSIHDTPFELLVRSLHPQEERPVLLPKALAGREVWCFKGNAAGKEDFVLVLPGDPRSDLCVDWNLDGDFSDDRPVPILETDYDPARGRESVRIYGPIEIPTAGSEGQLAARFFVRAKIEGRKMVGVSLYPATYRTGQVRLGGAVYRIALVDADMNGRYDKITDDLDGYGTDFDSDCFAIDLNNDGELDPNTERCPLTRFIRVNDASYELRVLSDGSRVRLARANPRFKLGRLEVGSPCHELTVFTPSVGLITLSGPHGAWNLPEGKYRIAQSTLVMNDEDGARWEFECWLPSEPGPEFEIVAGEVLKQERGLPLEGAIRLARRPVPGEDRWDVEISCALQGRGGELYCFPVKKNGVATDVLKVEILDEKGKLLASKDPIRTSTWRPLNWSGRTFRARLTPHVGPFVISTPKNLFMVELLPDAR